MYILSVDTTAKTAAAAVSEVKDGVVFPLCESRLNSTLTHSESILPMIDFCLKNSNVGIDQVDVLAISAGPGSFTGVRIGISTIKGLAFGNDNVKCVPVSALESLCENVSDEQKGTVICACMDARRNQFYNALFSANGKTEQFHPRNYFLNLWKNIFQEKLFLSVMAHFLHISYFQHMKALMD